ncbi:MAG TPA: glycoside hydrolase family 3 N-terminal domain-containing protein, partial [Kofleriaceae bacterium]|nr:glycoside hydrolase family 3 N-terminal domain-containing protein [Kofleriaceae bacterium]
MMGVAASGCGTEPAGDGDAAAAADDGAAASEGEAAQATGAHRRPRPPRVGDLVAAMTLDEKIGLLIGNPIAGPPDPLGLAGAGYVPGVARLGIPPLRFSDGPAGIRTPLPTTALPAPVALAATFSRSHAAKYGAVLGREAQARHQDVLFGPMVNLVRVPTAGRNFETLGEDPFLQSALIAPEVASVQRAGTIVTIKHLAENNQENNRQMVNVHVDAQTLHEIELPAFESAVGAGAGAVMCAYNKVNGAFSCENPGLLTDVLRGQWGFDGFVVSDYGANHSTKAALEAGLDIEFLST